MCHQGHHEKCSSLPFRKDTSHCKKKIREALKIPHLLLKSRYQPTMPPGFLQHVRHHIQLGHGESSIDTQARRKQRHVFQRTSTHPFLCSLPLPVLLHYSCQQNVHVFASSPKFCAKMQVLPAPETRQTRWPLSLSSRIVRSLEHSCVPVGGTLASVCLAGRCSRCAGSQPDVAGKPLLPECTR